MVKDDLLEELIEEENQEEVITLEDNKDPITKIAKVIGYQRHNFKFSELNGAGIPSLTVAYYFAKDLDIKVLNNLLAQNPENTLFNIISPKKHNNSIIAQIFPNETALYLLKDAAAKEKVKIQGKDNVPDILQYTDVNVLSYIAAQKVISMFPLVASQANRINDLDDLRDIISYTTLLSNAKNKKIIKKLEKIATDETYNAKELLNIGMQTFFSESYPSYFLFLDSIKKNNIIDATLGQKAIEELFGLSSKNYERSVGFSELLENPAIIKKLFKKTEILEDFNGDKKKLEASKPNLSVLLENIVTEYWKDMGFKKGEQYVYREATKEDCYNGLKARVKQGVYFIGEKVGILSYCDLCNRAGINGRELDLEEIEVIEQYNFKLPKTDKLKSEAYERLCEEFILDLDEPGVKIFEDLKKSTEISQGVNKFLSEVRKMDLIEKKLKEIF